MGLFDKSRCICVLNWFYYPGPWMSGQDVLYVCFYCVLLWAVFCLFICVWISVGSSVFTHVQKHMSVIWPKNTSVIILHMIVMHLKEFERKESEFRLVANRDWLWQWRWKKKELMEVSFEWRTILREHSHWDDGVWNAFSILPLVILEFVYISVS
jgi:hypothetical protein